MGLIENRFEPNVLISTYDTVFNWARRGSVWPMQFGLACCAIEMMAAMDPRFDLSRFGDGGLPRHAAPGRPDARRRHGDREDGADRQAPLRPDGRAEVGLAMGSCATCGGPYKTYAVTQGVDRLIPVDVYVPGCPPRPEALIYGLMQLQRKIDRMTIAKKAV